MIGDRIKLARKKAGYSLRSLADAMDKIVTPQAIGKYERGAMTPGSNVLIALCEALDVNMAFLLDAQQVELTNVDFRKKSNTRAKDRARVETEVIEWVQRYLQIEHILEIDSTQWHQPFPAKRQLAAIGEAEVLAEDARREWQLGTNPIPDMTELLEGLGLKVLITELPDRVDGLTCVVKSKDHVDGIPVIVINQGKTLERRRLTLAHELAHQLITPVGLSEKEEEKAAQRFAGAFLMPSAHVKQEVGQHRHAFSYKELIELKHIYRVSGAAFLVRLRDLGIISQGTMVYAFQSIARKWRTEEPDPLEITEERGTKEPVLRFDRLCYRALAEELISLPKAAELLVQPVDIVEHELTGPDDAPHH